MKTKSQPTILVTGSAGLIGTQTMEALSPDFKVVGFDVKRPNQEVPGTDFIECDLTDDHSVIDALDELRDTHGDHLASVVHLAAYYDFSGEPSDMYRKAHR